MDIRDFEIMAPVGSRDSLVAALQAGADSVYFGIGQLNMRSHSANHFTIDDLREIAATCREAGVKTYLTVNTIIYDGDIPTMRQIVDAAREAGISAVIACDVAVMQYCLERGVEVHLLHAKEPGDNFRADFDRYAGLRTGLQRRLCPRVHFKLMIFDCAVAYIGSANLTGAGIGMKGEGARNFEGGILTDEPRLVDAAADHFDSVFRGTHCRACRRKDFCGDRIAP